MYAKGEKNKLLLLLLLLLTSKYCMMLVHLECEQTLTCIIIKVLDDTFTPGV